MTPEQARTEYEQRVAVRRAVGEASGEAYLHAVALGRLWRNVDEKLRNEWDERAPILVEHLDGLAAWQAAAEPEPESAS